MLGSVLPATKDAVLCWKATSSRRLTPAPGLNGVQARRVIGSQRGHAGFIPTSASTATVITSAPPAPANTVAPDAAPDSADSTFVWTRNWFPVAVTEFLDPARPHPFTLMGRELVLWRDGSGAWRAFEDACPHRLAPLSEGRVEPDGTLLCAYHGWRFNGAGACTAIPQMDGKESERRACSNSRSCALSFPTREAQGLLWVWGEPGPAGEAASRAKAPAVIPELDELPASRLNPMPWFFRDLPYSHDYFVENVTDPAHVTVSHHNVAGNRYAPDQFVSVDEVRPASANGGFKYAVKARGGPSDVESSSTEFLPPSLVKIKVNYVGGAALILALYSCPTLPGRTRHIGRQILVREPSGRLPRGLAFFAAPMPVWLSHTLASVFLHQDQAFLHRQERNVASRDASLHTAKYYMPAPADNMTVAFRTWLSRMAGGGIPYAGSRALPPGGPALDRDALFDTYHTHTEQCAVCKPAFRNLHVARAAAVAAAFAALGTAAIIVAVTASAKAASLAAGGAAASAAAGAALLSAPPLSAAAAALLAALFGGVSVVLDKLIGMMQRYEYSHADNH